MKTILEIILAMFVLASIIIIGVMLYVFLSDIVKDVLNDSLNVGWHRCYRCKKCGAIYDPDDVPFICKYCGTEITRFHDVLSRTYARKTPDLNFDHDITEDCEIVIARKVGRAWEIMKKDTEEQS